VDVTVTGLNGNFTAAGAYAYDPAPDVQYFSWFDRISNPGFLGDNIHVLDPGTSVANVSVGIPGCGTQAGAIQPGSELFFTCPTGFGGPVKLISDQPVLASQRVQYYQSFSESLAQH
jgi:hypothetical protein